MSARHAVARRSPSSAMHSRPANRRYGLPIWRLHGPIIQAHLRRIAEAAKTAAESTRSLQRKARAVHQAARWLLFVHRQRRYERKMFNEP